LSDEDRLKRVVFDRNGHTVGRRELPMRCEIEQILDLSRKKKNMAGGENLEE
jgi:hypothetical protein